MKKINLLTACYRCQRIYVIGHNDLIECPVCIGYRIPLKSIVIDFRFLEK